MMTSAKLSPAVRTAPSARVSMLVNELSITLTTAPPYAEMKEPELEENESKEQPMKSTLDLRMLDDDVDLEPMTIPAELKLVKVEFLMTNEFGRL